MSYRRKQSTPIRSLRVVTDTVRGLLVRRCVYKVDACPEMSRRHRRDIPGRPRHQRGRTRLSTGGSVLTGVPVFLHHLGAV